MRGLRADSTSAGATAIVKTVVIPTLASPDFTCKSQVPPTLHIALLTGYPTYRRVCPLDPVVRLDVLPGCTWMNRRLT